MAKGVLYLIPTALGDETDQRRVFPEYNLGIINTLIHFVVEDERSARRALKKMGIITPISDLKLLTLNKHTKQGEINNYLKPALEGLSIGLLSEAGCPAIADPGAEVVNLAHQLGIKVVPLVGPSSILLAIMASGLNGQSFAFHGYLPIDQKEKSKKIKDLEFYSKQHRQTQLFIETPFRNQKLLEDLLNTCSANTQLCIATDITLPTEIIKTNSVDYWRKNIPNLHKRPAIFLILG